MGRKTDTKLVAHNIYSEWYVLIEDDPKESIRKTGNVYGKLARNIEQLKTSRCVQFLVLMINVG